MMPAIPGPYSTTPPAKGLSNPAAPPLAPRNAVQLGGGEQAPAILSNPEAFEANPGVFSKENSNWAASWVAQAREYQKVSPYPQPIEADPTRSDALIVTDRKSKVAFFPGREGYDESFLGPTLPMPTLSPELQAQAAPLLSDPSSFQLDYTHFSVIQNKERRMPMLTAVNLDGAQHQKLEREAKWVLEGRIAREHQLGHEAYVDNVYDKGHMVRMMDTCWGELALQGSHDSFVYTNAAPQHQHLNQRSWLNLENSVLNEAVNSRKKMTVFTGPVLSPDDPLYDNNGKMELPTRMPQQFWKVIVWNEPETGLQSRSYLMSQTSDGSSPIKASRVPLETVSQLTGIDFGPVSRKLPPS